MFNNKQIGTFKPDLLFIPFEGQPLTRYQCITIFKLCLVIMGIGSSSYILTRLE